MRRHRWNHYWPAILAMALGLAATPSTVSADDEPVEPSDDTTTASSASVDGAATPAEPPTAEPTEGSTEPDPPAETTAPVPPVAEASTTTTTPEPEPTTPPFDEAPVAEPSTPVTTGAVAEEAAPEPDPVAGDELDDELDRPVAAILPDGPVREIAFPVLGPVRYGNDWGACRDGCTRRHQGTDLIGVRMQPLLAAVDGTVSRLRFENQGTAGAVITITGADGWYYNYFHVNNDTPGTDDGAGSPQWQIAPQLRLGTEVRAGQVIGYMGDSGNAEGSVPHLHFEIRQPDRTPVNPYQSLEAARQRPACVLGADQLAVASDRTALSGEAVAIVALDGGGRWVIDRDGRLVAEGSAATIAGSPATSCDVPVPLVAAPAAVPPTAPPLNDEVLAAPIEPAAPAGRHWTVERGQTLWHIARAGYGVADAASTASLVQFVFESNRDQLVDPNELNIGMTLFLPPLAL